MSSVRVDGYRRQYRMVQSWLDSTVDGMTNDQFNFQPGGTAMSAGSNYLRHISELDGVINGKVRHSQPLMAGDWAATIGPSLPPQDGDKATWAQTTSFDVDSARGYGQAVYQSIDDYLAGCSDGDLDAPVDLSDWGYGEKPNSYLFDLMLVDGAAHTGEISAVKGVQGLKGYPF